MGIHHHGNDRSLKLATILKTLPIIWNMVNICIFNTCSNIFSWLFFFYSTIHSTRIILLKIPKANFSLTNVHRLMFLHQNTIYLHLSPFSNNEGIQFLFMHPIWLIEYNFIFWNADHKPTKWSIQCDKMVRLIKIDFSHRLFDKNKTATHNHAHHHPNNTTWNCQSYRILLYIHLY